MTTERKKTLRSDTMIGPVAWSEARKVQGLRVDDHSVRIEGSSREVLAGLVAQYERLFGRACPPQPWRRRASREVCRGAVRPLMGQVPATELPAVLR